MELEPHQEAYYWFLTEMWAAGESFLNIEQDIEIHESVVSQMEACDEPWCVFPYGGADFVRGGGRLRYSLGCTKFSADLMEDIPDLMSALPVKHWRRLDVEIMPVLIRAAYTTHVHQPPVVQHHVYYERCACLRKHEDYPVDNEGRYCP